MAINLLGSHQEGEVQKSEPKVEKYIPPEEKQIPQEKQKQKKEKEVQEQEALAPVLDLSEGIKRRRFWISLGVSFLSLIILSALAYGGYYWLVVMGGWGRLNPPPVANQNNVNVPLANVPASNVNAELPASSEESIQQPPSPPSQLPDTPLAPLRGAIVRFPNSADLFLVERNGELRLVVPENVTFKNGQKISTLSPQLIYTLPIKWQDIRKGDKIVQGQVDFDPRVLSLTELVPFLQ